MNLRMAPGVFIFIALAVIGGCDKAAKLPTVPVTGTVTYKGQGVANANVDFIPVDYKSSSAKLATGITDAQGRFTLQTHVGGSTFATGALVGDYIVTVKQGISAKKEAPAMSVDEWSKLSPEEQAKRRASSGMSMGKPSDKSNGSSGGTDAESTLPAKYADVKNPLLKRSVAAGGKNDFPLDLAD